MLAGFSSVAVTVTTACNLSCSYCPQRRGATRRAEPATIGEAARLVAASGHPAPRLVMTGGEPLLEPGLVVEAVRALRSRPRAGRPATLAVGTNGTRLPAADPAVLAAADVEVTVSFDGVPPAQAFRTGGSPCRVEAVLRRAASAEPAWFARRVGGRITLHSGNVAFLAESVDLLVRLGVRRIDVAPVVTPDPGWSDGAARELDLQLARLAATLPASVPEAGASPFRPFAPSGRTAGGRGAMCGLGAPDALFLDVDGSVAPCGAMVPSLLPSPPALAREAIETLGGLRVADRALHEAMRERSGRALRLAFARDLERKRSPRGRCASCPALGECAVCPAAIAFAPEQDPDLVPAIQCDWSRLAASHRRSYLARLPRRRLEAGPPPRSPFDSGAGRRVRPAADGYNLTVRPTETTG